MLRRIAVLAAAGVLLGALPASAQDVIINNGLAPPDPANVIDADDEFGSMNVLVENVGCDSTVESPCPMPWGAPTTVEVVEGGIVGSMLTAHQSSAIEMSGGAVGFGLSARDSASVTMSGGQVDVALTALDSATVTIEGGTVGFTLSTFGSSVLSMSDGLLGGTLSSDDSSRATLSGGVVGFDVLTYGASHVTLSGAEVNRDLRSRDTSRIELRGGSVGGLLDAQGASTIEMSGGSVGIDVRSFDSAHVTLRGGSPGTFTDAYDDSTITIVGTEFEVNGIPAAEGPIPEILGALTGTLESGEPLDTIICHQGCIAFLGPADGQIVLAPEPDGALLSACAVLGLALLVRRRVG